MLRPLVLACLLAGPAAAQVPPVPLPAAPNVELPAEVKAAPAEIVTLKPVTNCKSLRWVVPDGCSTKPGCDGLELHFSAVEGRYRVGCYGALGDVASGIAWTTVVVGKPPDPKPPAPPAPPVPTDPLTLKLQAAFTADAGTAAAKAEALADLVELYRQAGDLARDPAVTTTGQLVGRIRAAAAALVIDGLKGVRDGVAQELAAALPADQEMTADVRAKAGETFKRIHAALSGVK